MRRLLSAANLISLSRAALGPAVLVLLMSEYWGALLAALVIVCAAAASDMIDGYVARRLGTHAEIGRYLDAACDAIFTLGVFLAFLANRWLPVSWFLAIYFAEIIVPYLGAFTKQIGLPFELRWSLRLKGAVHPLSQIVVIVAALFVADPASAGDTWIGIAGLLAAVIVSLVYLADHTIVAIRRTAQLA